MEPSDSIVTVASFLFFFSMAGLLLGLLRPSLVLWWAREKLHGRKAVLLFFGLPALVSILAVGILAPQAIKETPIPGDGTDAQADSSPSAIGSFFPSRPPAYAVSADEEGRLLETMQRTSSIGRFAQTKAAADELKAYYPEGYFVLVRAAPRHTEQFALFLGDDADAGSVETTIHELTHLAGGRFCHFREYDCAKHYGRGGKDAVGFWIEDKGIVVELPTSFRNLPGGREALQFIAAPNDIDRIYFEENDQDLITTLDEVNAYIKSLRLTRAHKRFDASDRGTTSHPATLARQLYLFTLQLKNLKEHHGNLWEELKEEKALAFIAMRLVSMAEAEIALAAKEGTGGFDPGIPLGFRVPGFAVDTVENNLRLVDANRPFLDEFFAGVKELDGMGPEELRAHGVYIMIYEP